jgi:hypothetical protein
VPVVNGSDLVIEVESDTPGSFIPVNDMNRFSRRTTRSVTRTRVFMRLTPYTNRGTPEYTATISGFLNDDDPGQVRLREAMNTDVPVTLRILPDGVNGFTQAFYIGNQTADANPDPGNMHEHGWELTDAGPPVAVLLGPIL